MAEIADAEAHNDSSEQDHQGRGCLCRSAARILGVPGASPSRGRLATVRSTLVLVTMTWLVDAIVFGALFDVHIKDVAQRQGYKAPDEFVGLVESVRGTLVLIISGPLGCLSDRFDRLVVLRVVLLVFGTLDVILIGISLITDNLQLILVGVVAHAVFFQACSGTYEALLADLVKPGVERTKTYVSYRICCSLPRSVGPLLQAGLLTFSGKESALKAILLGGLLWMVPLALILWPMRMPSTIASSITAPLTPPETREAEQDTVTEVAGSTVQEDRVAGMPKHVVVPGLIAAFNLTVMAGAGATLKFFPIFFHNPDDEVRSKFPDNGYDLSERNVCLVMAVYWLTTALGSQMAGLLGNRHRTISVLILHVLGTLGLFAFIAAKPLWLSLLFFELRPMAINSTFALNSALTMDFASPQHRGKWAAISSLNRGIWAGSAAIGGYLADHYGFRKAFTFSGTVFIFCGVLYSPMLCIVPSG